MKHLLVPHKANQYRPHLIRWKGLTAIFALALVVQVAYGFVSTGKFEVLGRASNISTTELLNDTNKARSDAGLAPLELNPSLSDAAFMKAKDMFAHDYWAHVSPSGVTPWKWLGDVNYNYDIAGENLAKNFNDAQSTLNAWMASKTHRENVLGDRYQDVGFAVVEDVMDGRETTIIVAYYGRKATGQVAAASNQKEHIAPTVGVTASNPLAYFGSAIQSLSPVTVGILALLVIVGGVAAAAHSVRTKLPRKFQKSWKIHHGAYKLAGVGVVAITIIALTGGGQI